MSNYNEQIQQHNTSLQALIDTANALPNAGSGGGSAGVETCTITLITGSMATLYYLSSLGAVAYSGEQNIELQLQCVCGSLAMLHNPSGFAVNTSGNITMCGPNYLYLITGDCSISV